ncbi:MAG: Gfo/Idh/MocA family oxidoreductase, partial [Ferruginibacter sp.]
MIPSFAIIGCGRIAKRHAEQIKKVGNLVAVCDIDQECAEDIAQQFGGKIYLSLETLLLNEPTIDVVSICTPNGLHAEHAIECLRANKHVLCEKPLCISNRDAHRMIEASNIANRHLFVVKQNRYNPPVQALKKLLKEDKLGNIFSFQLNCFWNRPKEYYSNTWRGTKQMDGGTLFTQFSHFIDLLWWFLGDVKEVNSITRNFEHPIIEIEDCGVVVIEMLGGAIGTLNYTVNSFQKNMEGSFTLFGEKGTVKIGGQYLNELEYQCIDGEKITNLPPGSPPNAYGY